MVYCLLGIFGVSTSLIYGEGYKFSRRRLLREIEQSDPSKYLRVANIDTSPNLTTEASVPRLYYVRPLRNQNLHHSNINAYPNFTSEASVPQVGYVRPPGNRALSFSNGGFSKSKDGEICIIM